MSPKHIAESLQITVEKVKQTIEKLSDTRQNILIVDDELDALIPLKRTLKAEDYQVVEASSGPGTGGRHMFQAPHSYWKGAWRNNQSGK